MKVKLKELVKWYEDGESSLDNFIHNIKLHHREVNRIKSNYLRNQLHPLIQNIFWKFIVKVENETNMVYYGIENRYENKNTDIVQCYLIFQHAIYFDNKIFISYGTVISQGSGDYKTFRYEDDKKFHLWVESPTAHYSLGKIELKHPDFEDRLFELIKYFDDKIIVY